MFQLRYLMIPLLALAASTVKAENFPYQTLNYNIYYHCTFIHDVAATASVQISDYDGTYSAILEGRSIPIFGTIYCVNDTLTATYVPSGESARPAEENVTYQVGYYRKPHSGDRTFIDSPHSYRNTWGQGYLSANGSTMECVRMTADMLCMFYYAKTVEFDKMQQGVAVDVPIRMPSGEQRTLQLLYEGTTDYNGNPAYSMIANFTYEGQLSNYPVRVLISQAERIPLLFSASIAIGHVEMQLV